MYKVIHERDRERGRGGERRPKMREKKSAKDEERE